MQGPTAVLKSVSKLDNYLLSNGTLLNVKFTPPRWKAMPGCRSWRTSSVRLRSKLQHIQFNVVNAETLREAQRRPQDFAGLVVRVAGYSAFFVELSKEIGMTLSVGPRISCDVVETRADVARIFNIQRYSLNDGAGIRTVVFFKGCPHRCPWCANPESISPKIETVRRESKCLHCAPCLRDADECPSGAFERIGRDVTLDELEREVMKDDVFFRSSGGGVTLSGGEVLMQAPFATQLLKRLRRYGIHTAIETAGDAPLSRLLPLARQCDEVLFDLKIMDPEHARSVTAVNLPRVLENLTQLVAEGINVIPVCRLFRAIR